MVIRFGDINTQALKMFSALEDMSCRENDGGVRNLLRDVRHALGQQPGAWEALELQDAERALAAGFPRLALISAGKAIAVQQLSPPEYSFGFESARQRKTGEILMENEEMRHILEGVEADAAKKLESTQKKAATALAESQHKAAAALMDANEAAATALQNVQKAGLEDLKACEKKEAEQRHELENAISWMGGEYGTPVSARDIAIETDHALHLGTDKKAALDLKEQQDKTADDLKKEQAETARGLRKNEEHDAARLKVEQKHTVEEMKERRILMSLRTGKTDKKPDKPEGDKTS